ncbi:MAG: glycosyltransferase family 2 protein [Xanthomonadales bacterium]|nr:glycosyltransferase family 2 protein [Xanthomonadales bacterium]
MKTLNDLGELPALKRLAVIINCGTRLTTTLAVASLRAATDMPILLIDCESKDGSREHFSRLASRYGWSFYWLDWPLRKHGHALDLLFSQITAEEVLLVDSDVEIRSGEVIAMMQDALAADPQAYAAGFRHGPDWLGAEHGLPGQVGYYAERMWIPLTLLRTEMVRKVLGAGASFIQRRDFVEFAHHPILSRWLAVRFWLPGLRSIRWRQKIDSAPAPAFIEFDTGARVHAALVARGHRLIGLPDPVWQQVHHFHGVSRAGNRWLLRRILHKLGVRMASNDTPEGSIGAEVRRRLIEVYALADPLA